MQYNALWAVPALAFAGAFGYAHAVLGPYHSLRSTPEGGDLQEFAGGDPPVFSTGREEMQMFYNFGKICENFQAFDCFPLRIKLFVKFLSFVRRKKFCPF